MRQYNNLSLNTSKTKEIIVDISPSPGGWDNEKSDSCLIFISLETLFKREWLSFILSIASWADFVHPDYILTTDSASQL